MTDWVSSNLFSRTFARGEDACTTCVSDFGSIIVCRLNIPYMLYTLDVETVAALWNPLKFRLRFINCRNFFFYYYSYFLFDVKVQHTFCAAYTVLSRSSLSAHGRPDVVSYANDFYCSMDKTDLSVPCASVRGLFVCNGVFITTGLDSVSRDSCLWTG